jgi:hypothetical protein
MSTDNSTNVSRDNPGNGPKYIVMIEGKEFPWDRDMITTEQIATLGGFQASTGVIEVDADNIERTLAPNETVELRPGHGFSKKVRFKRGDLFTARVQAELELLRKRYPSLQVNDAWLRIPDYPLPTGWNRDTTDVAIQIPQNYPGGPPYGIYVRSGLRFKDEMPGEFQDTAANQPPFGGGWGVFSWTPESGGWAQPTEDIVSGPNLLNWVLGFKARFDQGK